MRWGIRVQQIRSAGFVAATVEAGERVRRARSTTVLLERSATWTSIADADGR